MADAKVTVVVAKGEGGWTWRVVDDLGTFESVLPSEDEAERHGVGVALSHGYMADEIAVSHR